MNKFTRGPVFARKDTRYDEACGIEKESSGVRSIIALMNDSWIAEEHGDYTANQKLVVAAFNSATKCTDLGYDGQAAIEALPDLLTLLSRFYESTYGKTDLIAQLDYEFARKAIAKARGGSAK